MHSKKGGRVVYISIIRGIIVILFNRDWEKIIQATATSLAALSVGMVERRKKQSKKQRIRPEGGVDKEKQSRT